MRRIYLSNNEAISRSCVVRMPGYAMPPTGEWKMELRRRTIATGAPAFAFSSETGNLRVIAYNAPARKAVLALLAPQQLIADLTDSYFADLVYVEDGLPKNLGQFVFNFRRGVSQVGLPGPAPAYEDLASWEPIIDVSGNDAATVLSMVERGLPGAAAVLPAGPWIHLATLTAADVAELTDATHFTSDFDEYEIVLENLVPAADGANLKLELQIGGFWMIDGYSSLARLTNSAGSVASHQTTYIDLSGATSPRLKNSGGAGLSGFLRFFNPAETANVKRIVGQTGFGDYSDSGQSAVVDVSASRNTTTDPVTGMKFFVDNGNLATGKIHIFGRKK
ncbi:hypothetical protein IYW40_15285 [Methylocystis sp. H4A]|uniref:hypothetical protein n=1 Tax=Methylocystis sp. H4A TaxID=2785788 RepID=UPI0018C31444|nr:hypothetical protein [Methylocystis sp. H4A]MBG0802829.1 hypothetical protein [Methylocystis sp. H4A]